MQTTQMMLPTFRPAKPKPKPARYVEGMTTGEALTLALFFFDCELEEANSGEWRAEVFTARQLLTRLKQELQAA